MRLAASHNEKIVCVATDGFGLDGGDDPAFDYVIQAATGIAAMTGHPDGPPTLPGYSSADNSTGLTAALGLLAQIVSGRGGQVDVSLRDVMLSQLNYRASAYLNDGVAPQRYPVRCALVLRSGAAVSDGRRLSWRCSSPTTGSGGLLPTKRGSTASRRWRSARRVATKCSASSPAALATDTAKSWEARLRPLGIPAAAVRTLPEALEATPEMIVDRRRLPVSSPARSALPGISRTTGAPPLLGRARRAATQSS